jgi:hypothetical protein
MDYQEFLQRSGERDSPSLRQAFEKQFGGSDNLGLGSPPEFDFASGSRIGDPSGTPGKIWGVPSGHASMAGRGGMTDYEAPPQNYEDPFYQNQVDFLNDNNDGVLEGGTSASFQGGGLIGGDTLVNPWDMQVGGTDNFPARPTAPPEEFLSHPFFEPGETNISQGPGLLTKAPDYSDADLKALGIGSGAETGLSAAEIALQSEQAVASAEAGLEALEAAEAAESGWGGPATFAANQALNMIPTRDRDKKVTPLGDEGSVSGILKGGGKGALLGATIGSAFPVIGTGIGAAVGGGLGVIGGAQGYFDSTSAPIMNMTGFKRRGGGMQGGLLGGGSMYG